MDISKQSMMLKMKKELIGLIRGGRKSKMILLESIRVLLVVLKKHVWI